MAAASKCCMIIGERTLWLAVMPSRPADVAPGLKSDMSANLVENTADYVVSHQCGYQILGLAIVAACN